MIDDIDREILRLLQTGGRMSNTELGRRVGLSPNAAGVRVQRLQEKGIITGFRAQIDHGALGRSIEASVDVWLVDPTDTAPFLEVIRTDDRIVECFFLTGPLDFRMRVRVSSTDDLNELLARCKADGSVRQTDTKLVLEQLPVNPDDPRPDNPASRIRERRG